MRQQSSILKEMITMTTEQEIARLVSEWDILKLEIQLSKYPDAQLKTLQKELDRVSNKRGWYRLQ